MTQELKISLIAEGAKEDAVESLLLSLRELLNESSPGSTRFADAPSTISGDKQGKDKQGIVASTLELVAAFSISGVAATLQTSDYLHRAHKFLKQRNQPTQCVFKHGGREVTISGDFGPDQITAALKVLHPEVPA